MNPTQQIAQRLTSLFEFDPKKPLVNNLRDGRGYTCAFADSPLKPQPTEKALAEKAALARRIALVLPIPPSANNLFLTVRGKRVKSAKARAYAATVAAAAQAAGCEPFAGPVGVCFHVYRARKCGDLANFEKALFDSLSGFFWIDDKQIIYIEAHRHDDKISPRVEIEAWEIEL